MKTSTLFVNTGWRVIRRWQQTCSSFHCSHHLDTRSGEPSPDKTHLMIKLQIWAYDPDLVCACPSEALSVPHALHIGQPATTSDNALLILNWNNFIRNQPKSWQWKQKQWKPKKGWSQAKNCSKFPFRVTTLNPYNSDLEWTFEALPVPKIISWESSSCRKRTLRQKWHILWQHFQSRISQA